MTHIDITEDMTEIVHLFSNFMTIHGVESGRVLLKDMTTYLNVFEKYIKKRKKPISGLINFLEGQENPNEGDGNFSELPNE